MLSALTLFARAGVAANHAVPVNTSRPDRRHRPGGQRPDQRSGSAKQQPGRLRRHLDSLRQARRQLLGHAGAHLPTYTLTVREVGYTIRFKVVAKNSFGSDTAFSASTPVIQGAAPPSRGKGSPAGERQPDQATGINAPARLLVDTLQSDPPVGCRDYCVTSKNHRNNCVAGQLPKHAVGSSDSCSGIGQQREV